MDMHKPAPRPSAASQRDTQLGGLILLGLIAWCGALRLTPVEWSDARGPNDVDLLLNPNLATAAELALLPEVGPARAAAIIASRPYHSLDDLDRAMSIGPATLGKIRPYLTLDSDDGRVGAD